MQEVNKSSSPAIRFLKNWWAFSTLERVLAAMCMAIPFFLVLADCQERESALQLLGKSTLIIFLPLALVLLLIWAGGIKKLWVIISAVAFTGVALWVSSKIIMGQCGPRGSISAYVAMNDGHIFGALLSIAASLFLYNGVVYINGEPLKSRAINNQEVAVKNYKKHARWYNILLGLFLFGVVFFPCTNPKFENIHLGFAFAFFIVNAATIGFVNDKRHRPVGILLMVASVAALLAYLINGSVTLFWAESIALWVIGIHYILESMDVMS